MPLPPGDPLNAIRFEFNIMGFQELQLFRYQKFLFTFALEKTGVCFYL